jgi:hypothetical protein
MNLVVGALGVNLTFGLIKSAVSTTQGIYNFCNKVAKSTSSGADEIKSIITETDLVFKVRHSQMLLCEIKVDKDTPYTIKACIKAIHDGIKNVSDELDQIYYRMQYNDNLWFGSRIRSYKFKNSKKRLIILLNNLDSRREALTELIPIQNSLVQNPKLEDPSFHILQIEDIDPDVSKKSRDELYKKIDYIGTFKGQKNM